MIRREHGRDWLIVSQLDHARLAGALAGAWNFSGSRMAAVRDELVQAVAQHDEGWSGWEHSPTVDPQTGAPRDFSEMPMPAATAIWSRSIAFCLEHHPPPALGPLLYCYREWLATRRLRLTNDRIRAVEAVCRQTGPFTAAAIIDELEQSHGRVSRGLVGRELGRLRSFGVLAPTAAGRMTHPSCGEEAYDQACPLDLLSELGGLWVSRHFQWLAERAWDSRTERDERLAIDGFLDEQMQLHERWRSGLPREFPARAAADLIDRGFRWVQFFDRLSLWLCSAGRTEPAEFEIPCGGTLRFTPATPRSQAPPGNAAALRPGNAECAAVIEFEPRRVLNSPLELAVPARRLPARRYETDADLQAALAAAPVETVSWRLVA